MSDSRCMRSELPTYHDDDILCRCMSIKRSDILPLIDGSRKRLDFDDIVGRTGAGSVCMGCHPLIEEMMGEAVWTPVKIVSIQKTSSVAKIYRFESLEDAFLPAKSGQHIIVQAYIDGVWEMRRYTLTTIAAETTYREIIIQRGSTGRVSNWFHQLSASITKFNEKAKYHIRVSQPVGDVTPDLVGEKHLICLVGGIGITPAISFVRSIAQKLKDARKIIIDHSVLNEDRLILKDELDSLASQNEKIYFSYRLTNTSGFINQNDINEWVASYPDCDFYVCGPQTYSNAVLGFLEEAGVSQDSISIEHFSSSQVKKVNQSKTYFYLGLVLFGAFLFQELFQLKMLWLETLQSQQDYKIYSGLFVVLYLFTQFIMPYNKCCETPHVSANTYQHHKLRGALAPLVFFVHSTQFGVAYLFMLSMVYFTNILLGLFNHERIENPLNRIRYFKFWLPIHIMLSVLTMALIAFHIYVIASY